MNSIQWDIWRLCWSIHGSSCWRSIKTRADGPMTGPQKRFWMYGDDDGSSMRSLKQAAFLIPENWHPTFVAFMCSFVVTWNKEMLAHRNPRAPQAPHMEDVLFGDPWSLLKCFGSLEILRTHSPKLVCSHIWGRTWTKADLFCCTESMWGFHQFQGKHRC